MSNLVDHPHAVLLTKRINRSQDGAVPVQLFLNGVPPLSGAVTLDKENPGVFKLITMGVSLGGQLRPGEIPPPIATTFTADQICAVMWPDEEVMIETEKKSRIIQ